jgi:hypothetical protein
MLKGPKSKKRNADELAGLKAFLKALESPHTALRRSGKDIKPREIAILKREIAHLKYLLLDLRRG